MYITSPPSLLPSYFFLSFILSFFRAGRVFLLEIWPQWEISRYDSTWPRSHAWLRPDTTTETQVCPLTLEKHPFLSSVAMILTRYVREQWNGLFGCSVVHIKLYMWYNFTAGWVFTIYNNYYHSQLWITAFSVILFERLCPVFRVVMVVAGQIWPSVSSTRTIPMSKLVYYNTIIICTVIEKKWFQFLKNTCIFGKGHQSLHTLLYAAEMYNYNNYAYCAA